MSKLEEITKGLLDGHQDWKIDLSERLQNPILSEMSRINEQCIYRIPTEIRQVNPKAFTPEVVCIGPFHRPHSSSDDKFLWQMEEFKRKYVKGFLSRTAKNVEDLVLKLEECENKIRSSYAMKLDYETKDLIEIVIVDACFIIELFLRWYSSDVCDETDPLFMKQWVFDRVDRDLVLLENQLPFFVLDVIYNFSEMNNTFPSFLSLTLDYFGQSDRKTIQPEDGVCHPKHFTDLLRTVMLPISFDSAKLAKDDDEKQRVYGVYCVSQLSEAGLKFKVSEDKDKSFLDLEFKEEEGVLTMPSFEINDSTEECMRNILAFEECHLELLEPHYISQYFFVLDFLINNEKDLDKLIDKKIIISLMGDKNDAVKLINSLCNNVTHPRFSEKYFKLCKDLNRFYENPWNKYKATFRHEYFNTPWKIASTIAAVLLLLLTLIQTICSVIQVVQGSK